MNGIEQLLKEASQKIHVLKSEIKRKDNEVRRLTQEVERMRTEQNINKTKAPKKVSFKL